MESQALLSLSNVRKTYAVKQGLFGKRLPLHALSDVSFHIDEGEAVGLVGESGCGKSTLAKILLGLLEPSAGDVMISGHDLRQVSPTQRARLVQPVFQDPYSSLNPRKTVSRIVGLPLDLAGVVPAERDRRVLEILDHVGLPQHAANAYPSQMSGGQRQRVAIARALISRPRVLICDEPTSALDVSVQSQILNLLQDLRAEFNLSYLIVSHDLSVIRHMADRVVVMYLGRVVEEADTEALFDGAGHPYTQALLAAALPTFPGRGLPAIDARWDFPNPIDPPTGCPFHPRCSIAVERCSSERPDLARHGDRLCACHLAGQL